MTIRELINILEQFDERAAGMEFEIPSKVYVKDLNGDLCELQTDEIYFDDDCDLILEARF